MLNQCSMSQNALIYILNLIVNSFWKWKPPTHTHPLGHKHDKCTEDQIDRQTSTPTLLET